MFLRPLAYRQAWLASGKRKAMPTTAPAATMALCRVAPLSPQENLARHSVLTASTLMFKQAPLAYQPAAAIGPWPSGSTLPLLEQLGNRGSRVTEISARQTSLTRSGQRTPRTTSFFPSGPADSPGRLFRPEHGTTWQ